MSIITHPSARPAQATGAKPSSGINQPEVTQAEHNDPLGLARAVGITVRVSTR